jgi:Ca2+-binding RTX toxin-like protein
MLVRYRLAILTAATFACTAPAHAATLVNSGGTLTYTAAAGGFSDLSIDQNPAPDSTVNVERNGGDGDAIIPTGCTVSGNVFTCPGVSTVVMDLGDADDYVEVVRMRAAITINGGVGDDALYTDIPGASALDGGPGADYVFASGPAADTINGGEGDDILGFVPYDSVTHGADLVNGGPGIDEGRVEVRLNAPAFAGPVDVALSLDGVANDGIAGQGANFVAVEDATALSLFVSVPTRVFGRATLTGSAAPNLIEGDNGNDVLDGGAGNDVLDGDDGDDTINARDGFVDRVTCDSGNDIAIVDPLDQVAQGCESVHVADAVGPGTNQPPPAAPAPAPAGPPATAVPTVTVSRVAPRSVSLRIKGSRASGTLSLPAGVTRAQGCRGTVKLTVKAGRRTIATRTVKLSRSCTYSARLPRSSRKIAVKATFGGNDVLSPRSSAAKTRAATTV